MWIHELMRACPRSTIFLRIRIAQVETPLSVSAQSFLLLLLRCPMLRSPSPEIYDIARTNALLNREMLTALASPENQCRKFNGCQNADISESLELLFSFP
jgi:hypothetical protein